VRLAILLLAGALGLAPAPESARADDYPNRTVQFVTGFAPGGNGDTITRLLAAPLADALGKPVVVENKTGAAGNIAADYVAKAKPDGHTMILLTGGHAVSAALYRSLPFDPVEDFAAVSSVTFFPFVLSVRREHAFRTLGDAIAAARATPGSVSFSSVGVGSTQHLIGELIGARTGVQLTHVPYRGGMGPLNDLLGGHIDLMSDTLTVSQAPILAGTIRGLGVTSALPWPTLPGVPTVAETVPGFEVRSYTGLVTTKGTPPAVIARLNQEVRRALALPELKRRLEDMGNEVRAGTPDEFRGRIVADIARWSEVIRTANVPRQ
jgi:tripartite-type tricarboxylate transporter receptor subunit TctC